MGYGLYGGGFGGYGGYGGVGGSPGVGSQPFPSGIYPPGSGVGSDQFLSSGAPKKKGVAGFLQGIANGAINTVKSLFTLQGLATTVGAGALVWATGGAALIPLAALGAGIGGFQMLNGAANGDTEAVGEGFFATAASLLGLKFTPKKVTLNGQEFTLSSGAPGQSLGITGRLKSLWGGNKFVSADGVQSQNIWQLGSAKLLSRFQSGFSSVTSAGFNPLNPQTWKGRNDVENLPTLDMNTKIFAAKYQDIYKKANEPLPATNGRSGTDGIAKLNARNGAKAELELLEAKAQWPKAKTRKTYLELDKKFQADINDIKLQRGFKKLKNASDAELKAMDQMIQGKENLRVQLLDTFKEQTATKIHYRQNVIQQVKNGGIPMEPPAMDAQSIRSGSTFKDASSGTSIVSFGDEASSFGSARSDLSGSSFGSARSDLSGSSFGSARSDLSESSLTRHNATGAAQPESISQRVSNWFSGRRAPE
ncbi:hypothetical protein [Vampirovibrio sp.]|uniref:hypothetical protein n=1 Tax=Vampirovibrio sp. TaxID=2717857 RepID=UPI003593E217